MLRYNFSTNSGLCARQWGTTIGLQRYFYSRTETRNMHASEGIENNIAGIPNGHTVPSSWVLPQSNGSIAAYENLRSTISLSIAIPTAIQAVASTSISSSTSATLKAIALISGAITPFTELSPKNLADAVWSAESSEYTTTGTMGKQVNSTKTNADLIPAAL